MKKTGKKHYKEGLLKIVIPSEEIFFHYRNIFETNSKCLIINKEEIYYSLVFLL